MCCRPTLHTCPGHMNQRRDWRRDGCHQNSFCATTVASSLAFPHADSLSLLVSTLRHRLLIILIIYKKLKHVKIFFKIKKSPQKVVKLSGVFRVGVASTGRACSTPSRGPTRRLLRCSGRRCRHLGVRAGAGGVGAGHFAGQVVALAAHRRCNALGHEERRHEVLLFMVAVSFSSEPSVVFPFYGEVVDIILSYLVKFVKCLSWGFLRFLKICVNLAKK